MTDIAPTSPPRRAYPLTIADFGVAILGLALVFTFPWENTLSRGMIAEAPGCPPWCAAFVVLAEAAHKATIVLTLIIAARLARNGGAIRASHFLAVVWVASLLVERIVDTEAVRRAYFSLQIVGPEALANPITGKTAVAIMMRSWPYWYWLAGAGATFLVSLVLLRLCRKNLPTWARFVLIAVAVIGFGICVPPALYEVILAGRHKDWAAASALRVAALGSKIFVDQLLLGIVVACVLRDALRHRLQWGWPEWCSAACCYILIANAMLYEYLYLIDFRLPSRSEVPGVVLLAASPLMVLTLGAACLWAFGPSWRRWAGIDYDESDLLASPSEA